MNTLPAEFTTLAESNSFAASLLNQFNRRGSLSQKQWFWVNKLTTESAPASTDTSLAPLADLVTRASANLKYPKIHLRPEPSTPIRLSRAGSRARFPGSVNVTNGAPYGDPDSRFYGRILTDGTFQAGRDLTPAVRAALTALADDPVSAASEHGHRTGACCFCNRELTDPRSVHVGYGPVCADHYGLPHGEVQ